MFGLTVCRSLALAAVICSAPAFAATPQFGEKFQPVEASVQQAAMGGGINVLGYDPGWQDHAKARFQPELFAPIRAAGFKTVRIAVQAFDFMKPDGSFDPAWLARLDGFIKAALDQGLIVILDEHDFWFCGRDPEGCRPKLKQFWRFMAPHYAQASNRLLFEILNEPNNAMTPALWNEQLLEMLAIIRESNPTRNVIIGPGLGNDVTALPKLELPENDRHIIATVHYYHPMDFTHQGAGFAGPPYDTHIGVTWGKPDEVKLLEDEFDGVKAWADAHRRPIFLGEFGVFDRGTMSERVKYTKAVRQAAEARGFSWAWWQFDGDFVLWDYAKPGWVEPLLEALLPAGKASQ